MVSRIISIALMVLTINAFATTNIVQECLGCHTEHRENAPSYFTNGFGRWKDNQCFGCHKQIHEVSENYRHGINDSRYVSLPVTDKRLLQMEQYPLPYLNAPQQLSAKKVQRFSRQGLIRFLRRPDGKCDAQNICKAPTMMVYPTINEQDLESMGITTSDETISTSEDVIKLGESLYMSNCQVCHRNGGQSKYDSVGLSLFSQSRLGLYQHKEGAINALLHGIDYEQRAALQAYFISTRTTRESIIDNQMKQVTLGFDAIEARKLSLKERNYIWGSLWRDGGCVHCHGIEGRAQEKFDTSTSGLTKYLKAGHGRNIYYRLRIKELEHKYGMSAGLPGMPMTGMPLPPAVINLVGRWIKAGCQSQQGKNVC